MAPPAPQTVALAFGGPISRGDLPALCDRVGALLDRSPAKMILCDVAKAEPDAVTLDALARVHLTARRRGCDTCVRGASGELIELLDLMGLRGVLRV
jgi:ABC-type transporter Mla MlaB component